MNEITDEKAVGVRELLRSSEGEISQAEFRRGARFLALLSIGVIAFLYAISRFNHSMEWMTVAIAPFFGVVIFFVVCSLIYFWFCIFAKRSRATGNTLFLVYSWLGSLFAAAAFGLVDYQNITLHLSETGPLAYTGFVALALAILAVVLFVGLVIRNWIRV